MDSLSPVHNPYGRLVSLSYPCPGLAAPAFLRHAHGHERFYWEDRREGYALAGFGIAAELVAWGDRFDSIQRQSSSFQTSRPAGADHGRRE